ncbi:glucosamine-6-phosphate deaminase [Mesorhizobium sp. DCY119]|uniref:glucosamine-6-phosphate deaminase n=1 Tax=Mesorhizobium sp. DCY119 TaxID=2108445 RepID=UPI000E742F62|nr:glucosamine-6-phosphate deaminase [Mesorhizobium sp. DCY119]RJG41573.1 glucosamine-6-phosphate deaminase [Mesorhizobium sp. DCY119]
MSVMSSILSRPKIIVSTNAEAAAQEVARRFEVAISVRPDIVLGLATGNSPKSVYDRLVAAYNNGKLSFARVTSFNLDEYCGLPNGHPSSFSTYMREKLFSKVDIEPGNYHLPDGGAPNLEAVAKAYEAAISASGGIDLQLLGIGRNGHIAFNEPGSSPMSRTRAVELSAITVEANRADFPVGETPPRHAITMGIGTILEAREIVLLATGAAKAAALDTAINGPVCDACPASFLQLHPNVTIVCDNAAYGAAPSAVPTRL